jgi:hypothetical protein
MNAITCIARYVLMTLPLLGSSAMTTHAETYPSNLFALLSQPDRGHHPTSSAVLSQRSSPKPRAGERL